MGASQGVQSNIKIDNDVKILNDDESLEIGILDMAKQLYSNYYQKFNDVELCKNIGLVAADKLEQFDSFTLKKISDKQNSGKITLKPVFISQNLNKGDLFEIEKMPKLLDYFDNKYFNIPICLDNKKTFDVPYLSTQLLNILKNGNKSKNVKENYFKKKFKKDFKERKGGANSIEIVRPVQKNIFNKENVSVTNIVSKKIKKNQFLNLLK